jgi:hypothetical protein
MDYRFSVKIKIKCQRVVMRMRDIEMVKKRSIWKKNFVKSHEIVSLWRWMLLLRLLQRRENLIWRF